MSAVDSTRPLAYDTAEAAERINSTDPDRTEKELGISGPGLKFQVMGGMESSYGVRIRPGDVIRSLNRLHSYVEREGRFGLMLFTVTEDTWTNQHGGLVKTIRNTLIRY